MSGIKAGSTHYPSEIKIWTFASKTQRVRGLAKADTTVILPVKDHNIRTQEEGQGFKILVNFRDLVPKVFIGQYEL